MNIQHSSRTDAWLTPVWILDAVRAVLGKIDLDPASSAFANDRVGAAEYLNEQDDGLIAPWCDRPGTIFLNPPGGKRGNPSLSQLFWKRLMDERDAGRVQHAIFMAFSAESLQTTQRPAEKPISAFAYCVPSKRIRFDDWEGNEGKAPSHSNVIVYVPGAIDKTDTFASTFSSVGYISAPYFTYARQAREAS